MVLKKRPSLIYEGCDTKHFGSREGVCWPSILRLSHPCIMLSRHELSYSIVVSSFRGMSLSYPGVHSCSVIYNGVITRTGDASRRQTHSATMAATASALTVWNHPSSGITALILHDTTVPCSLHDPPPMTQDLTSQRVTCATGAQRNNCLLRSLFWVAFFYCLPLTGRASLWKLRQKFFTERPAAGVFTEIITDSETDAP